VSAPSLDGRVFRAVSNPDGEVSEGDTLFHYSQDADLVHARYEGGGIRLGFLVGVRRDDELDFRYAHVNPAGETATGHCVSRIEVLDDGRLRLHERWSWDSREGSGVSVVEERGPGG
jgi:hypothetical protein